MDVDIFFTRQIIKNLLEKILEIIRFFGQQHRYLENKMVNAKCYYVVQYKIFHCDFDLFFLFFPLCYRTWYKNTQKIYSTWIFKWIPTKQLENRAECVIYRVHGNILYASLNCWLIIELNGIFYNLKSPSKRYKMKKIFSHSSHTHTILI